MTLPDRQDHPIDVVTFGCRLNTYESEIIRREAIRAGLTDTVIVNTCAVTSEAARQARQAVRKLRRERPGAKILVTGCAAQVETGAFAAMAEVDHVIGNAEKLKADTYRRAKEGLDAIAVGDIMNERILRPTAIESLTDRARAFVQIQNGCDHRCTFCIIPYGRGPSRSLPGRKVVEQIKRLVDNGYKEVVLTGVDLTSYRGEGEADLTLGRLVTRILEEAPNLPRLRLSSIDSIEVDDELFELIAGHDRLMPHLHLSLQSGDPMILKRMKRRHRPQDAAEFCARLRDRRPDLAFSADIIAGFPTETDRMFENTVRHLWDCDLAAAHIFPFSPRPGTPAARMPQCDRTVVRERAKILRGQADELSRRHRRRKLGRTDEVLVEKNDRGLARDYTPVAVEYTRARPAACGDIIPVKIEKFDGQTLTGVAQQ